MPKTSDGLVRGEFDTLKVNENSDQNGPVIIGTVPVNADLLVNGNIVATGTVSGGGGGGTDAATLQGATWEAPLTIGSTTPNTGAFTTLSGTQISGTSVMISGTQTVSAQGISCTTFANTRYLHSLRSFINRNLPSMESIILWKNLPHQPKRIWVRRNCSRRVH